MNTRHKKSLLLVLVWLGLPVGVALAHGQKAHAPAAAQSGASAHAEQMPWGTAGTPQAVTRTVVIDMQDTMRFSPDTITVKLNQTLRFELRNRGKLVHEMVIGDEKTLREHAKLMVLHPTMEHDAPYMAHVDPGKKSELIWTFNRLGRFQFACLLPGHFEAGMVGTIEVRP